ncbi:hypothetical protein BpHYR1_041811 [Brachionus plicatilis]|uniref:Uncharacterized protein n=1 Tax=Brachionus plicatilis TaxID=10195 RepID=A0A3M7RAY8_BRAPC|nr:hypothetical protein BpHYR1_041811 [Brachionus plicatilis]
MIKDSKISRNWKRTERVIKNLICGCVIKLVSINNWDEVEKTCKEDTQTYTTGHLITGDMITNISLQKIMMFLGT